MAYLQQQCQGNGNCWLALGETLAPKGSWQTSTLNCCEDAGSCCFGLFCLPCLFGDVHNRMHGGGAGGPCLRYCLLSLVCLCVLAAGDNRRDIRARFNLRPEPCGDCCVHCCLGPCAVCQEARECKKRGVLSYQPPATQFVATAPPPAQAAQR